MTLKSSFPALLVGAALLLLASVPARSDEACVKQIKDKCTQCHYQTRICEKIGRKSLKGWKVTIERMQRYGLKLTPDGQEKILNCLDGLERDSGTLCQ